MPDDSGNHRETQGRRQPSTLQLVQALSTGWGRELNASERTVLEFIAKRGRRGSDERAFTWVVLMPMAEWAESLGMPYSTLRRTLRRLVDRGYLERWKERDATRIWRHWFAIPMSMFDYLNNWNEAESRAFQARLKYNKIQPDCSTLITKVIKSDHQGDQSWSVANSLTSGFATHNPCKTQERNPKAKASQRGALRVVPSGKLSDPGGVMDDFDSPSQPEAPLESSTRSDPPRKRSAPSTRLADLFWREWARAREQRPDLAIPSNSVVKLRGVMKRQLEDFSEEEISNMVLSFFRQVSYGRFSLHGEELFQDFLRQRSRLQRTPPVETGNALDVETPDEWV